LAKNTGKKRSYKAYTRENITSLPPYAQLPQEIKEAIEVVGRVLPFRTNNYVAEELIDWTNIPDDPIFQLTFPQPGMLSPGDYQRIARLLKNGAAKEAVDKAVAEIRYRLNPHPAGQLELNVPELDGQRLKGVQRKYRETVLFFPRAGQTCHAYCTYCFRWAQFIGDDNLQFAASRCDQLLKFLRTQPDITDLLITGGDPLVMRTKVIRRLVEPLLTPEFSHLQNIRFGTKAVAYWPQRFVSDPDADDFLRLCEEIVKSGRHVTIMAHYSHPVELSTAVAEEAVRRLRNAGCEIRVQAPIVRHVNDRADSWAMLWSRAVRLGAIPYYMFIERDTGPKGYFEVPLARAYHIFREALSKVSGLARTVRGPSMSATPGKVVIDGVVEIKGERCFVLSFLQARLPDWVKRPFLAKYDPHATWLTDLRPAFGEKAFFFQQKSEAASWCHSRHDVYADSRPLLPGKDIEYAG